MTDNQLWAELALDQVADNLRNGTVQPESTVVHDTTHYHAHSTMKVVDLDVSQQEAETPAITESLTETETAAATVPPTASQTSQPPRRVIVNGPAVEIGRIPVVRVRLDTLDEATQQESQENKTTEADEAQSTNAQPEEGARQTTPQTKKAKKKVSVHGLALAQFKKRSKIGHGWDAWAEQGCFGSHADGSDRASVGASGTRPETRSGDRTAQG